MTEDSARRGGWRRLLVKLGGLYLLLELLAAAAAVWGLNALL